MSYIKLFATLAFIVTALAIPSYEKHHHSYPSYEFKYGVNDIHTHDIKEQAEKRHGDKVQGYYMFHEADGTIRTVHYTADKHTGFHAHVQKSGHPTRHEPMKHLIIPAFTHESWQI